MVKSSSCESKIRAPRVLKVGTDFSGMEAPIMALRCMDPPITMEHVFSSDCMPAAKRLSELMFKPKVFKDDVKDVSKNSYTDVYVWGAPCIAYSKQGKGQGVKVPTGRLLTYSMKYISKHRPRLTVMENVPGLALMRKHKPVFKGVLKAFKDMGYVVKWKLLNRKSFNTCQSRQRIYLAAIRNDSVAEQFVFPSGSTTQSLTSMLEDHPNDKAGRLPEKEAHKALAKACYRDAFKIKGINPLQVPVAVDIDCSPKFRSYGIDELRTLTAARVSVGGPWISTKGRRLTIEELFKCQGFNADAYKYREANVSKRQMGVMLGNTMTLPVVGAVLEKALVAAGLVARDKPKPIFISPLS